MKRILVSLLVLCLAVTAYAGSTKLEDESGVGSILNEDAAHASGQPGIMALTVRKNTAAALSGTDADYQPLITDTNGRLHVLDANSADTFSVHVIENANAITSLITTVSAGTITAGSKIVGYSVLPYNFSITSELIASLYDSLVPGSSTYFLNELENTMPDIKTVWFPVPRAITTGLSVIQGANTRVAIYYY